MPVLKTESFNTHLGRPHNSDVILAYTLLRLTLGVNIAGHGISRILAGPGLFATALIKQFANTPLPQFAVAGFAYALPWMEALVGVLILAGAETRVALAAGALLMVVLTFGSTLHQDWEIAGLQLIYAMVYFGLLAFRQYNLLSVDATFNGARRREDSVQ